MPSTTVLANAGDFARVDAVLGFVYGEVEALRSPLERPEKDAEQAYERAKEGRRFHGGGA